MKRIICWSQSVVFVIFVMTISSFAQARNNNSISGYVFDADGRNPVPEVYVELMNDIYSTLKRVRTDGTGRFYFGGLSSGTFKVKVLPYGTNYLESIQDVSFINYSVGSGMTSDTAYLDFYLKLDKRKASTNELNPAGLVFVQDVPLPSRNFYKQALSQLGNVKEANLGLENLKKAIEGFPNYYDALNRLGIEHMRRNQYYEALPYLIKAIQVNQRSFSSYYALGLAAYNLKQVKEATEAFRATTIINPQSAYAHFQYGRVLRIGGNYKEAEQALSKAKSLSKNSPIAETHWQLGLLYDKIKRYNDAADELERFLEIEPDIPNIEQIKKLIAQLRTKSKK